MKLSDYRPNVDLPSLPDDIDPSPYLAGGAMIAAGLFLKRWRPRRLALPTPKKAPRRPDPRSLSDVVHQTREAVAAGTPDNLTAGIGRTLVLMGVGLLTVAVIDELEDRDAL